MMTAPRTRRVFENAASVVTLAGPDGPRRGAQMSELAVVENGSVVVDSDGRIDWVGAAADLPATLREGAAVADCRGKTLMPAFVDAHTHLVYGGARKDELELRLRGADYEEIFAKGGGILSSVRQTRATTDDDLFAQARARILRMRRCGTTTFEIKSGYGLELDTELRQLRVARRLGAEAGFRVRTTCLAAHAVPAEARTSAEARAAWVRTIAEDILPAVASAGLADYADVFCDRGAFDLDESRTVLAAARALGLGLRVHANELGPTGGARLAAELGAASADHLLHVDDADRRALAGAGTVAVLLPGTSLVLGKPFADGRALVAAGVAVAIATDCNPGSCAFENLAMVLAIACYGNRLSVAEAICAATHNAAASLDLSHEVGSLVPGKSADLLVLGTADVRDLVYHAGSPFVDEVWQAGERVA
jgi:imidazolonepropionase